MSASCMQAITQQLEAMPLEEFEDLLKGVAATKGHEARTQHGELISQLKHHVKVQPDEPIQSKPTDKECKKIWTKFSQENKSQFPSTSSSSISEGSSTGVGNLTSTFNGNVHTGTYLPNSSHRSDSTSTRSISACGDQNANAVASNTNCTNITDNASSFYPNSSVHNSVLGRYHSYNNHHGHQSTLSSYSNSLDGDPGGYSSRRSHERDRNTNKNVDNTGSTGSSSNKSSMNSYENTKSKDDDDDDTQETYLDPEEFIGSLPPQYILPGVTKFNATSKDLPLQLYSKPLSSCPLPITAADGNTISQQSTSSQVKSTIKSCASDDADDQPGTSKEPWNLRPNKRAELLQLNDGYKSVASVTSGSSIAPTYMGRSTPSASEDTYGSIRAVSPTLPSSAMMSKSPTIDGSQSDKPALRRGTGKKKSSKNVLRETVINPQEMPGYKGTEDIDKLLEFVLGNQTKVTKKTSKDKKQQQHGKPAKANEKQVLSKAASLDENSLGYGSKKSNEDTATTNGPRNRNSKDVEKKNSTNITKSASAICDDEASILSTSNREVTTKSPSPPTQSDLKSPFSSTSSSNFSSNSLYKNNPPNQPLVNGGLPPAGPKAAGGKTLAGNVVASGGNKTASYVTPKNQTGALGTEKPGQAVNSEVPVANSQKSEISPVVAPNHTLLQESKQEKSIFTEKNKSEDDRFAKPDESDGPYVLVQSKKKREKKKPQRESEHFVRSHQEQTRREGVRPRRSNTERRKSVGSVPGSENSECSDDDDSVRSLPAGECTPRERIPKPCSSSGGTPQTSYADIARMSKDENGKTPPTSSSSTTTVTPPIAIATIVPKTPTPPVKSTPPTVVAAVTSSEDLNFPALSPSTSSEQTATTPVNTAVWTFRPRIAAMETPVKTEKQGSVTGISNNNNSNSNKPEDACTNHASSNPINMDGGFPPITVVSSSMSSSSVPVLLNSVESNKCSSNNESTNHLHANSKSIVENFAESIIQINNNNINNNNKEIVMVPIKSTLETSPKVDGVVQNGISPRPNVILDITSKPQVVSNKGRSDEKKLKERTVKTVPDDFSIKQQVSSKPASENGDFYSTEPVVFCGGKFDSTQLPVGQKIGFEFGFGVIEALNDNTGVVETTINGPKSLDFATIGNSVNVCTTPPTTVVSSDIVFRFQEKSITLNCKDSSGSLLKSTSLTNEELPPTKPYEKSLQNPPNTQKSNEKSRGPTNLTLTPTTGESVTVARAVSTVPTSQQPAPDSKSSSTTPAAVESSPAFEVPQGHDSSKLSGVTSDNTASVTATTSSSNSADSVALKETTPKVDIAQIYKPPKIISVPDSVHQALAFMENYASRLTSRSKEGKLSFHRIA